MATPKCIVFDLDGTLLNSDQMISARNQRALDACRERGISIVIATGRPPRAVRHLLVSDALRGFVIYLDGALTIHESRGVIYNHQTIPAPISTQIIELALLVQPHVRVSFEVLDAWYPLRSDASDAPNPPHAVDRARIQALSPTKIILSGFPNWERVLRPFDPYVRSQGIGDAELIQILEKSVCKEWALGRVLDSLGVGPEDVMVFGDGLNDLGMFGLCGYPVAMGNAVDSVKMRAKYITDTNDDEGVAVALRNLGVVQ